MIAQSCLSIEKHQKRIYVYELYTIQNLTKVITEKGKVIGKKQKRELIQNKSTLFTRIKHIIK